jgi:hypothetical protein
LRVRLTLYLTSDHNAVNNQPAKTVRPIKLSSHMLQIIIAVVVSVGIMLCVAGAVCLVMMRKRKLRSRYLTGAPAIDLTPYSTPYATHTTTAAGSGGGAYLPGMPLAYAGGFLACLTPFTSHMP